MIILQRSIFNYVGEKKRKIKIGLNMNFHTKICDYKCSDCNHISKKQQPHHFSNII